MTFRPQSPQLATGNPFHIPCLRPVGTPHISPSCSGCCGFVQGFVAYAARLPFGSSRPLQRNCATFCRLPGAQRYTEPSMGSVDNVINANCVNIGCWRQGAHSLCCRLRGYFICIFCQSTCNAWAAHKLPQLIFSAAQDSWQPASQQITLPPIGNGAQLNQAAGGGVGTSSMQRWLSHAAFRR